MSNNIIDCAGDVVIEDKIVYDNRVMLSCGRVYNAPDWLEIRKKESNQRLLQSAFAECEQEIEDQIADNFGQNGVVR